MTDRRSSPGVRLEFTGPYPVRVGALGHRRVEPGDLLTVPRALATELLRKPDLWRRSPRRRPTTPSPED